MKALEQIGLVVHPRREIDDALTTIREWAQRHGIRVGQVPVPGQTRHIEDPVEPGRCDLVIAVGGDGTTLAALHAGAPLGKPVLGVAHGSIGALTSLHVEVLGPGLEQVVAGNWRARPLPGLDAVTEVGDRETAINDIAVVRAGVGQVITHVSVDGVLYSRIAGDGLIVSTSLGSSAYTLAAGGPILAPGNEGMVVTPLASHGGVAPPLVAGAESRLDITVEPGYGGARFEVDGQVRPAPAGDVVVTLRGGYATLIELGDQEPMLTGLRRRGLIVDGPRLLARDARQHRP